MRSGFRVAAAGAIFLLAALPGRAQSRHVSNLVKDINPNPTVSSDTYAPIVRSVAIGGRIVFSTPDHAAFASLWSTDGTAEGTTILRNVVPYGFTPFHDSVYFIGVDGGAGGLWRTDGTSAGTMLVRQIGSTALSPPVIFRGELYFRVGSGSSGLELWKSDGTTEGTGLAVELPLTGASDPVPVGDRLYFFAGSSRDPARPFALYWTDGTALNTAFVKDFAPSGHPDICPAPCPMVPPSGLAARGDIAYFLGNDGAHGQELWRSDGTAAGTAMVIDLCRGECSGALFGDELTVLGNRLYFSGNDGARGFEPWSSDGTAEDTRLIGDVVPGPDGSFPLEFVQLGSRIIFVTKEPPGYPFDLWSADPVGGTALRLSASVHAPLVPSGGVFYFPADRPPRGGVGPPIGWQLMRTDGTAAGTIVVEDSPGAFFTPIAELADKLLFASFGRDGVALWSTDGSVHGAALLRTMAAANGPSSPAFFHDVQGSLILAADDGSGAYGLWKSDGSSAGTRRIGDLTLFLGEVTGFYEGSGSVFRSELFFYGVDPSFRAGLWKSDGSDSGTNLVKTVSGPGGLTVVGDTLFFVGIDGLWKSDGTENGTVLVKTVPATFFAGGAPHYAAFHRLLFFSAPVSDGFALWRSDGTDSGTFPITGGMARVDRLTVFADALVFTTGDELWRSDGTSTGTVRVATVASLSDMAAAGPELFFTAPGPVGYALWSIGPDFSAPVSLNPGGAVRVDTRLTAIGSQVFFGATDPEHGSELWASDGTLAGTRMVRDIAPGQAGSFPSDLAAISGILLFAAGDELHGREVWRSDGTEEGTGMVDDIVPGAGSSNPMLFTVSGALVYFSADDGQHGRELWAMPVSALFAPRHLRRSLFPRVVPPR